MNVDSFDRDTTRVATFTLPNSVSRALGIASANSRNSSGVGFHTTVLGSTGSVLEWRAERRAGRAMGGTVFVIGVSLMSGPFRVFFSSQAMPAIRRPSILNYRPHERRNRLHPSRRDAQPHHPRVPGPDPRVSRPAFRRRDLVEAER